MSVLSLERETIAHGTDLASLVIAYHRRAHTSLAPGECAEEMCRVANQCLAFDEMYFGMDDN